MKNRRKQVWEVLTDDFLWQWIRQSDTVLDWGAAVMRLRRVGEAFKLDRFDLELAILRSAPYTMKGRLTSSWIPFRLLSKLYLRRPVVGVLPEDIFS